MSTIRKNEPILIEYEGEFIDVQPFIRLITDDFTMTPQEGLHLLHSSTEDTLRLISTKLLNTADDIKPMFLWDAFSLLYSIKDLSKRVSVFENQGRK